MELIAFLPVYPVIVLILFSGILFGIRLARPKFGYFWLVAVIGCLLAWPLVLIMHNYLPGLIEFPAWKLGSATLATPRLIVDEKSWPIAFALVSLALALVLTDVARASEADWSSWSGALFMVALGLLAVMAGNPLMLLLSWAAIDLAELLILLRLIQLSEVRERLVVAFSARVSGIVLLVLAGINARSFSLNLSEIQLLPEVNIYLLLAAGLRLGVLPLHQPFILEVPLRRGLGTMLRLVPAAASFIVLARVTALGVPQSWRPGLLLLSALAALYAAFSWSTADNELDGRPFWILGMAAFAVAASVIGEADASLAWGIATLLGGGLLFFYSARHRYLMALVFLGTIGLTALPFTPAWNGARLYAALGGFWFAPFLLSHLLLVAGYLRHGTRATPQISEVERWVWFIYPWGLSLILITHYLIGIWSWKVSFGIGVIWPGAVIGGGIAFWYAYLRRKLRFHRTMRFLERANRSVTSFLSLNWLYRILWVVYRSLGRLINYVSFITEGDGGVLWSLLLLVLVLTLMAQSGSGG